jgi:hypothetical protein
MPFTCSICGEESTRICVWCTKDACNNHLCEKCLRCSDCCACEVRLSEPAHAPARPVALAAARVIGTEPPQPPSDAGSNPESGEDPGPVAPELVDEKDFLATDERG